MMARRIVVALVVLTLLGLAGFASYQVGTGRWPVPFLPGNGTLQVFVQDAPGGVTWSHVNITFSSIEVHRADAGNDSGWSAVPLTSGGTVDLTALRNVSQLLGKATLPPGKYTQIRIVVARVEGVMANGTTVGIGVPSGEVKIDRPFNITAGATTKLTLDIPLDHLHWEAQGWVLSPVVGSVKVEG